MNYKSFLGFSLLLCSIPLLAQVNLPILDNCPSLNKPSIQVLQNWQSNPDTVNYCLMSMALDEKLKDIDYGMFRDTLINCYQMRYDSARSVSAVNYASYGIKLAEANRDTLGLLIQLNNLAFICRRIGRFVVANYCIVQGKRLSTLTDNHKYYAKFIYKEAFLLRAFLKSKEALKLLEEYKALIASHDSTSENWYHYYNGVATNHAKLFDFEKARFYGDSALHFARKSGDNKLIGLALSWCSWYYPLDNNEEIDLRIKLIKDALDINYQMNDREQLAANYGMLASHYSRDKQWEKAIKYYNISLNYGIAIKDKLREQHSYTGLYQVSDSLGNKSAAYEYKLKEAELFNEIYGYSSILKIKDLQKEMIELDSREKIKTLEYEKELSALRADKQRNNLLMALILAAAVIGGLSFNAFRLKQKQKVKTLLLERETLEKIKELEKKALRAQMNPHFIFNCLNSIKSYIIKNEPRIAARYLTKFAQLMRLILRNSQHQLIPISEELKALKLYIELEQFRLSNKFIAKFEIDPGLNLEQLLMPPLILQPYIENAILHGLSNKEGDKILKIQFIDAEGNLKIQVHDNGIGRIAAAKLGKNKTPDKESLGLKITKERLRFNNPKSYSGNVTIIDQYADNNESNGTSIVLILPYKYSAIKNPAI